MRFFSSVLFFYSLFSISCFSQSNQNISFYRENQILYEKYVNSTQCKLHSSVKPFINSVALQAITDSIQKDIKAKKDIGQKNPATFPHRISVSPVLFSQIGYEQSTSSSHKIITDGGLQLEGIHSKKLSYNLIFLSGKSAFPSYIDTAITQAEVIPGIGTAYKSGNYYSYQYFSGYLSYSPSKIFNIQIGKGKHFFGDGHRSLFLSDVSNAFPYLKITATVWKFQYTSLFAWLKDITAPSGFKNDYKNKFASFHYLSWNVTKRFNVALFESVIWQGTDANRSRSFDVNYLNPVIFYRPVEYSLGSSDNVLLGASFKEKIAKKQLLYGQVLLDEFLLKEELRDIYHTVFPNTNKLWGWWGNKYGIQLGFKSFDLFTIKNLSFQTEVNYVRPFTYAHGSVQQNYGNYNQPLAHPLHSNFIESVSFLNYRYKNLMLEGEIVYAKYGKDSTAGKNLGNNIFKSYTSRVREYGNYLGQGRTTHLIYIQGKVGYIIIPSMGLIAEAGAIIRQEENAASTFTSKYIFVGIKTSFMNRYSDF